MIFYSNSDKREYIILCSFFLLATIVLCPFFYFFDIDTFYIAAVILVLLFSVMAVSVCIIFVNYVYVIDIEEEGFFSFYRSFLRKSVKIIGFKSDYFAGMVGYERFVSLRKDAGRDGMKIAVYNACTDLRRGRKSVLVFKNGNYISFVIVSENRNMADYIGKYYELR